MKRLWLRLVKPSRHVTSKPDRRQAKMLAAICLLSYPMIVVGAFLCNAFGPSGYVGHFVVAALGPAFVLSYILARSRRYRAGAMLYLVVVSTLPLAIFVFGSDHSQTNILRNLVLAYMIAGILVSLRWTVYLVAFDFAMLLALPLVTDATWPDLMSGVFIFIVMGAAMVLLLLFYLEQGERDRRADLVHSERFLRTVLDASPLMVGARDRDGRYLLANAATARFWGLPVDEVEGATDKELAIRTGMDAARAAEWSEMDRQVMRTGQKQSRETDLVNARGERRRYQVTRVDLGLHEFPGLALTVATDVTEERQALVALAASEERWFHLFEQSEDGIGYYDLEGRVVRYNQEAARRMNGVPDEFVGLTLTDIFGLDAGAEYQRRLQKAIETGQPERYQDTVHLSKAARTFTTTYTPIKTGSGVDGVMVVSTEITELVSAMGATAQSQRRLQSVYDALGVGVVIQQPGGRIIDANEVAARILDVPSLDLLNLSSNGASWRMTDEQGKYLDGNEHPAMVALTTGEPVRDQVRAIYSDDPLRMRWLLINSVPVLADDGEPEYTVTTFLDVTDVRAAESLANSAETRYRAIQQASPDGIIVTDGLGRVLEANPAAIRLLGGPVESDCIGRSILRFAAPDDRPKLADTIRELSRNGVMRDLQFRAQRLDGSTVPTEASSRVLYDAKGEAYGAVTLIRDISERLAATDRQRATMQMFNDLAEALPIGIDIYQYHADPEELVLLLANPASTRMTGIGSDQIGWSFDRIWPAARESGLTQQLLNVARTGETLILPDLRYADDNLEGVYAVRAFCMAGQRLVVAFEDVTEQVEAAQERERMLAELASSHQLLEQAQDIAGLGVWRRDLDMTKTGGAEWSDLTRQYWGIGPDEPVPTNKELLRLCHEDDRDRMLKHLAASMAGEVQSPARFRIHRRNDGVLCHLEITARPATDPQGVVLGLVGITRDVTDEVKALEDRERTLSELARTNRQLEYAQDMAGMGSWYVDREADAVVWSSSLKRMYGLQAQDDSPSVSEIRAMVHPEDREQFVSILGAGGHGQTEIAFRIIKRGTDEVRHLLAILQGTPEGEPPAWLLGVTRDVTDEFAAVQNREQTLQQLERTVRQFEYAQALAQMGSWQLSDAEDNSVWSPELMRLYGMDPDASWPAGFQPLDAVHPEDHDRVKEFLDSGGHGLSELQFRILRRDNGEVRYLSAMLEGSPADEPPRWLFGVTRDITDEVHAAAERERMLYELERTVRQFEYAQSMAKMGSWQLDVETGKGEWSPELKRLYGLPSDAPSPIGPEVNAMVHPDDRDRIAEYLEKGGHGRHEIQFRIIGQDDGQVRHVKADLEGSPEGETPLWLFGVTRDITDEVHAMEERQRYIAELAATNNQMASAQMISKTGSWRTDVNTGEMVCSAQLERLLGREVGSNPTLEEIASQLHPDDAQSLAAAVARAQQELVGYRLEDMRVRRHDTGEWRHAYTEAKVVSAPDGRPLWVIGVVRDTTDEVAAAEERERTLQERQEALQQLENAQRVAGIGTWRHDYHDLTTRPVWSDVEWEHWGRTLEDGTPRLSELIEQMHPDDQAGMADFFDRIKSTKAPEPFRFRFYRRDDGQMRYMSAIAQAAADAEGVYRWIVGVTVDITDEVLAAQERERFVAELQEANSQLEGAQRLVGLGWWRRDLADDTVAWSGLLKEVWGLASDGPAPSYDEMLAMIHPEDREGMDAFYEQAQSSGRPARYQMRIYRNNDGELRHVVTEAQAVFSAEGRAPTLIGAARDVTDEVAADEALRESEARYRLLAENSSDVIWTADLDGRFTYMSPSVEALRGFTASEVMARPIWDSITPESRAEVEPLMAMLQAASPRDLEKADPVTVELEQPRKDGSTVWTESVVTPIVATDGNVAGVIGVSRDISERRAAQEALLKSEESHRLLVEYQSDMLIRIGADNRFQYASLSFCELFGKEEHELLGQHYRPLIHPDDRQAAWAAMQSLDTPPYSAQIEYRAMTTKGWRWLAWSYRSVLNEEAQVIGMVGAGRDVTDRVEAELALADSESILRQVLDSDPSIIFAKDPAGRFQIVNKAFSDLQQADTPDLIGISERELGAMAGTPADVLARWELEDRQVIEEHRVMTLPEICAQTALGERWYSMIKVPLTLPNNRHWVLGIGTDVTERRRLEEQLRQAAKMEAVGRLAGGVAHDFNNLLTVINGYSAMLLAEMPTENEMRDEINEIHQAGERAASLTRQLLAFSRRQGKNERVISMNDVLKGMRNMLQRLIGEDIGLRWRLANDLWTLKADPGQIEQIVINLAVNARDAMPNGGSLVLETSNVTMDRDAAQQHADLESGEYVVLEVTDTGIGMSEEVHEHLFEPFFTTKEVGKGTGLGLAVVYGVVTQSHGAIHVYSDLGMGASFRIYFPRVERDASVSNAPVSIAPKADLWRGSETILLVEDEEPVRRLAQSALERNGYRVLVADGPVQARSMWAQYREEIDLLMSDVIMPGESGPEMAHAMSQERPSLPIIFVSGYSEEVLDDRQLMATGARLVRKPFSPTALARAVREMLDDRQR